MIRSALAVLCLIASAAAMVAAVLMLFDLSLLFLPLWVAGSLLFAGFLVVGQL